ncbi:hypothetical protein G7Y89_g6134 [Cudoniella acicularis]|uniref:Protein kinase domain-containing protein n=1 Tax=Cudoniella acicularis TaxID=354080 RepID=A0A8H4W2R0_9HELO|nr:hypothetical protein G7Y89_g6134 [Cudoniella acicularis]
MGKRNAFVAIGEQSSSTSKRVNIDDTKIDLTPKNSRYELRARKRKLSESHDDNENDNRSSKKRNILRFNSSVIALSKTKATAAAIATGNTPTMKRKLNEPNSDIQQQRAKKPKIGVIDLTRTGTPPRVQKKPNFGQKITHGNNYRRVKLKLTPPNVIDLTSDTPPPSRTQSAQSEPDKKGNAWIENARYWLELEGKWEPVKCLGHGGYGITGLFRYIGLPDGKIPKFMSAGTGIPALRKESQFLQQLMGQPGIVQIYRSFHLRYGAGTHKEFDPYGKVARIYLEYGDLGDLYHHFVEMLREEQEPEEIEVWNLIKCLADGALSLERGNPINSPNGYRPIMHFDINPMNVLVFHDNKKDLPTFKLTDFGLSSSLPENTNTYTWMRHAGWRGTKGFQAPEQYEGHPDENNISLPANIYGIGIITYAYIFQKYLETDEIFVADFLPHTNSGYRLPDSEGREVFYTKAPEINGLGYSSELKKTLFQCLAFLPSMRPSAGELSKKAGNMIKAIRRGEYEEICNHNRYRLNLSPELRPQIFRRSKFVPYWNMRFEKKVYTGADVLEADKSWDCHLRNYFVDRLRLGQ